MSLRIYISVDSSSVDIPVEDGVYQHVIDKVVHDAKLAADASPQSDLKKQNA